VHEDGGEYICLSRKAKSFVELGFKAALLPAVRALAHTVATMTRTSELRAALSDRHQTRSTLPSTWVGSKCHLVR